MHIMSQALTQGMRRCLFLIDGIRTVRDLSHWLRASEINEVIADLERAQYIIREADGSESALEPAGASKESADKLEAIKSAAVTELYNRMGSAAALIVGEIEPCKTALELRIALRVIEDFLVVAFGGVEALEFVKSVGSEAMEL
jgi:hypothetical protein